ncbi:hypothetical protein O3M35_013134 [Rhynocoris fuscipes]|uniref:Peptidase S1 domain-containing protein n=1 Tax=Rhynocoris fuscipes TaxID=488301 RepID=A0AAW1CH17_9HEMI
MMLCLTLILFIALVFVKGVAIVENNVRFIVEIWNKENKTDICFGVLVAPQVVLMTSCSWFKNTVDVDLSKILMVLGDEERYIQEIRINNLTHVQDSNKEPLILIISKIPFASNIFPLSINGGDLIETCQEAVIKKYVISSPSDDYDQYDTFTHMARDMNPLPYEACKRLSEDIVLHKNEFCAIEPTNHSLAYPKLSEGIPVLCDHHLTGLKLYSKNLVNPTESHFTCLYENEPFTLTG